MVFLDDEKQTLLEQRTGKGIWQNLYQFPLLESQDVMNVSELKEQMNNRDDFPDYRKVLLNNEQPIVHKLYHQHLHTNFWNLHTDRTLKEGISWENITAVPVPVLIADFIKTYKI